MCQPTILTGFYVLKYYGISKIRALTADGASIHLFMTHSPQNVAKIDRVTFAKCGTLDYSSVISVAPETSQYHSRFFGALLGSGVLPNHFI
jgi:hypothetical protein